MGTLGQQQFTQGMDINKLQSGYGNQQQQQVQNILNQQYEDFLAQKKFPYQQLEFQSNLLRGTPSGVGPVSRGDVLHGHIDGVGDLHAKVS